MSCTFYVMVIKSHTVSFDKAAVFEDSSTTYFFVHFSHVFDHYITIFKIPNKIFFWIIPILKNTTLTSANDLLIGPFYQKYLNWKWQNKFKMKLLDVLQIRFKKHLKYLLQQVFAKLLLTLQRVWVSKFTVLVLLNLIFTRAFKYMNHRIPLHNLHFFQIGVFILL